MLKTLFFKGRSETLRGPHICCFLASSISLIFSLFSIMCWFLIPMIPPVHFFLRSVLLLNSDMNLPWRVLKSERSSLFTLVRATQVAVFMWQNLPRADLDLTKQKGTCLALQRAGRKQRSSMGSQSEAMTTSLAFPSSQRLVTWLRPNLMWLGLGPT